MDNLALPNERIDDLQIKLQNGKSLYIIQNPQHFCFGIDAVLLAKFSVVPKGAIVVDLCTGTGIIPLLIAAKTEASNIIGVEIQKDVANMASRSIEMNGLDSKISIINEDLKNYGKAASADIVICNPPYKEVGGGLVNPNSALAIARHEVCCTLSDVIINSSRLLKVGGKLNLIHRPERLVDIICYMRENKLEPKKIQYIHPNTKKAPTMVMISATKGGNSKITTLPPIFVYNEKGEYTKQINEIYGE